MPWEARDSRMEEGYGEASKERSMRGKVEEKRRRRKKEKSFRRRKGVYNRMRLLEGYFILYIQVSLTMEHPNS